MGKKRHKSNTTPNKIRYAASYPIRIRTRLVSESCMYSEAIHYSSLNLCTHIRTHAHTHTMTACVYVKCHPSLLLLLLPLYKHAYKLEAGVERPMLEMQQQRRRLLRRQQHGCVCMWTKITEQKKMYIKTLWNHKAPSYPRCTKRTLAHEIHIEIGCILDTMHVLCALGLRYSVCLPVSFIS